MISVEHVKAVYQSAELLADKAQVMAGFDRMATAMTEVLADQNPLLLCVMNGGLMTMSELLLRLDFPLQCDYVHVSRYQGETSGQASVHWKKTPSFALKDRVVVIVDDVLDGGVTLAAIVDYCEAMEAEAVYTAVMVDKPEGRVSGGLPTAHFTGITLANRFLFGFGLDYHEYLRNVPGIYAVADRFLS